jgi:TetR/AcrR family transcriptional repressor of mexJK operon
LSHSASPARAGRPKDTAKRAAILAAAQSMFCSQAYETVTMEAVAARAGVSKMTVYSHFADKETVFETVVAALSDQMTSAMAGPDHADAPLMERLTAIGVAFLTMILDPSVRTIRHSLPAALHGDQTLARRFYEAGPGRTQRALASLISEAAARGEVVTDSAEWAADDLLSLWEGTTSARLVFGLIDPTTPEDIAWRARRGTEVFLRAYSNPRRARGGGATASPS